MNKQDFLDIVSSMGDNSVTIALDIINGNVNMLIASIASAINTEANNYFVITSKKEDKNYTYYIPYDKVLAIIGC